MDAELVFLTIPAIALLASAFFTYLFVWRNRSEREQQESDKIDKVIQQLRKRRDVDEKTKHDSPLEYSILFKDYLAKINEEQKYINEKMSILSEKLNTEDKHLYNREIIPRAFYGRKIDRPEMVEESSLVSVKAAMNKLSSNSSALIYGHYKPILAVKVSDTEPALRSRRIKRQFRYAGIGKSKT